MHPCDVTADCAAGQVCSAVAKPRCFTLECAGFTVGVVPCNSTGMCVPATASALNATLRGDGRTISVALNAAPRQAVFPCARLFNNASAALLGNAVCAASGDRPLLTVMLPSAGAAVMPGDALAFDPNQAALVDALSGAPFNGSFPLGGCEPNCPLPVVALSAPTVGEGAGSRWPAALRKACLWDTTPEPMCAWA